MPSVSSIRRATHAKFDIRSSEQRNTEKNLNANCIVFIALLEVRWLLVGIWSWDRGGGVYVPDIEG
jgi:hypothetical protein